MHAMQYEFEFPDGFDMDCIRRRVAEIGERFDQLSGLRLSTLVPRVKTTGFSRTPAEVLNTENVFFRYAG